MQPTRRNILASALAALALPGHASGAPLVFAAASLKAVLDRISAEVTPMRLSYGGSGAMARQIMLGAPADLFLSANPVWMDPLAADRPPLARKALLGNRLVMVSQAGAPDKALTGWQRGDRLAMGFTGAVPAGQYGKAALQALGIWDQLAADVVETDSVSGALTLVAQGAVPFGVVYATDAMAEPRVSVVAAFDPVLHDPITYPVALLSEAGRQAYNALTGPHAAAIFAQAGFKVL